MKLTEDLSDKIGTVSDKLLGWDLGPDAISYLNSALEHPGIEKNMASGMLKAPLVHELALDIAEQLGVYARKVSNVDRASGEIYFNNGSRLFYDNSVNP